MVHRSMVKTSLLDISFSHSHNKASRLITAILNMKKGGGDILQKVESVLSLEIRCMKNYRSTE